MLKRFSLGLSAAALAATAALTTAYADNHTMKGMENMPSATAELKTADGKSAGSVQFVQTPNGVLIMGELQNASPGVHGVHIHETGKCEPDFKAAGDHFAPNGNKHGFASEEGYHAGDLPNVTVGEDGTATFHVFNENVSLGEDEASLMDDDGSAVIVHAKADSYMAEAGAGDRDACGVVTMQ
ncbi:superoxide dismutase family protein [Tepidamorphus sp. 3E244]|uniref:superoxide dismutase family protein n=1 Tax=Tepidamorphus sp. 3E244 TaxID=3385498 RepID=UPI0038FD1989